VICLAPIDGATDAAFRTIVHELGVAGLAAADSPTGDPAAGDIRRRPYGERVELLRRHIALHREYLGSPAFARVKRFFKVYLFDDEATVAELYRATDHAEALASLRSRAVAYLHEKTCEAS
jgi:tRNA-dihydrouridine synthase